MPAMNFYCRFADLVTTGAKRQSVRLRQFRPGQQLHMFTGLRTRSAIRLGIGTVTRSRPVVIDFMIYKPSITLDGITLSMKEMEAFARADGFPDLDAFMDFFADHYDLPLQAWVTEWDLQSEPVKPTLADGVAA